MAESVDLMRRANARQAGRAIGQDPNQPRSMSLGIKAQAHGGDIIGLPEHEDGCPPLQVLNTSSGNFGLFYFLPGYDTPGDANHPLR